MPHPHRVYRSVAFGLCGAAVLLCATSGWGANNHAAAGLKACKMRRTSAQESMDAGHLREARALFESCAKPACGGYLNQECTSQATQLDADIPSVVPIVIDGEDAPRVDVEVKMDGAVLTSKLDGQSLPVDPGMHVFTFSADQRVFATETLMIVQGQRNRPVTISMPSPDHAAKGLSGLPASNEPASHSPPSDSSPPVQAAREVVTSGDSSGKRRAGWAPWFVGGLGLTSVGAGALLVYWGRTDNASLVAHCANGGCAQAGVDHVRAMYLAGNILAGAGVAAIAVSTVWLLVGSARSGAEKPPATARYRFDVQPARSGAFGTLSGAF